MSSSWALDKGLPYYGWFMYYFLNDFCSPLIFFLFSTEIMLILFQVVPDIKKSSGIPQSFMTPVEDPSVPGALMTPSGTFAVPTIDM